MSSPRFRLDLAYDGTGFAGWQVQPDRRTVQGELQGALGRLGESVLPTGAGRTDAGVHALETTAHVDLERDWDPETLQRALRASVPADIAVLRVRRVEADFHARYFAAARTYHYALGMTHNPFFRHRRWAPGTLPDPDRAASELERLLGDHDMASFAKTGSPTGSTRCRVTTARWTRCPGGAVVTLTADRFLYGMVRAVVGTLIRGGAGTDSLEGVLARGRRSAAGMAAPPEGLYLARVVYPGEEDRSDRLREVVGLAGLEDEHEATGGGVQDV